MLVVSFFYFLNNLYLKNHTVGLIQVFFVNYFNDFICGIVFLAYINFVLCTRDKFVDDLIIMVLISLLAGIFGSLSVHCLKRVL